jgi:hypothetical protein
MNLSFTSQIEFFFFPSNFLADIKFAWLVFASTILLGLGVVDDIRRVPILERNF